MLVLPVDRHKCQGWPNGDAQTIVAIAPTLLQYSNMECFMPTISCPLRSFTEAFGGKMEEIVNGPVLRELRLGRGWDQKQLAIAAGINPSVVSRLERGMQRDVAASVLIALAQVLAVPVDALLKVPHHERSQVLAEVTAAVADLSTLSEGYQRQGAAILRAFIATIPK